MCLEIKKTTACTVSSAAKKTIIYGDYKLSYSPRKNEIIINYNKEDDEYTVKVKKGILVESDEYKLVDNRLYLTEIELQTPFVMTLSENRQIIEIYDGDNPTGLALTTDSGNE